MFTSAAARHEVLEASNWGRAAVSECSNVLPFFHMRLVIVAGGIWTYMAGRIEVAGRQAGRQAHHCSDGQVYKSNYNAKWER